MRILLAAVAAAAASLACAGAAGAATYFVSNSGSDGNVGTAASAAWRTVDRVNRGPLRPGDTVLFAGGQTFSDATLMPGSSGAPGAPIAFGSYGAGRATIANTRGAVWFSGKRYLTFRDLVMRSGSKEGIFSSSSGAPSTNIVLRDSLLEDTGGAGVMSANHGDSGWTVSGNTIRDTGDSGIIVLGGNEAFTRNTITRTGSNRALDYGKHGIYAKGPDLTIADNDFSHNIGGQSISLRFHGARVYGNRIHDTPYAIAFFDYDTAADPQGTSYVYGNRAWNITGYGFYYDDQPDPNGRPPGVDFVLASNSFALANASEAVDVARSRSARVTIANNVFSGTYGSALSTAATTVEHHNLWYGFASGKPAGEGDLFSAPSAAATVDRGTARGVGLLYRASCTGSTLTYCGAAPDLGAAESRPVVSRRR